MSYRACKTHNHTQYHLEFMSFWSIFKFCANLFLYMRKLEDRNGHENVSICKQMEREKIFSSFEIKLGSYFTRETIFFYFVELVH